MLSRNRFLKNYQRGSWAAGSKHQKHMTMNPTLFLYRFPGSRGPGPYTMKYWWTLGCFPTGLEVPFRLDEFLATYKQEYVPEEVEEWLSVFLKDPVEELVGATEELLEKLEENFPEELESDVEATGGHLEAPGSSRRRGYTPLAPNIVALMQPLKRVEKQLLVEIPRSAVRATLSNRKLRKQIKDDLFDYQDYVKAYGSTPHRRWARESLEGIEDGQEEVEEEGATRLSCNTTPQVALPEPPATIAPPREGWNRDSLQDDAAVESHSNSSGSDSSSSSDSFVPAEGESSSSPPAAIYAHPGTSVGAVASPPPFTAPDEAMIVRILTTFAQGAEESGNYDAASELLTSALLFSHDTTSQASAHANLSSALVRNGKFQGAEYHGREAALLYAMEPTPTPSSSFSSSQTTATNAHETEKSAELRSSTNVEDAGSALSKVRAWSEKLSADIDGATLLRKTPTLGMRSSSSSEATKEAEAPFLKPQPALQRKKPENAGARGFATWCAAVAYQDDFERAASIVEQGLSAHPTSDALHQLQGQLLGILNEDRGELASSHAHEEVAAPRIPRRWQGSRAHLDVQRARGLLYGEGRTFNNEFDFVVFKNKLYPSKMNPSSNEMGSVFRRVGDLGGMRSTSRVAELL